MLASETWRALWATEACEEHSRIRGPAGAGPTPKASAGAPGDTTRRRACLSRREASGMVAGPVRQGPSRSPAKDRLEYLSSDPFPPSPIIHSVFFPSSTNTTHPAPHTPASPATMSVSVDDLVACFNSSHIGQEAMDLAALQVRISPPLPPTYPVLST